MRFSPLDVPGPVLVEIEPLGDERGLFARSFCEREFAAAGTADAIPAVEHLREPVPRDGSRNAPSGATA